jgi:hypothetical protein
MRNNLMQNDEDKRPPLRALLNFLRRLFGRKPTPPPGDPYSYVMAPVRRGPGGRRSAAVAEPEDDSFHSFPPRR